MDVKNVRSWVRQFKEGRTSCENKPKEPPPRTGRSEDMIARVEQMVQLQLQAINILTLRGLRLINTSPDR